MTHSILDALRERVLLCDGGTGSRVQAMPLDVERDYWGQENCTEILNLSRPDIVRELARGYFQSGSDIVQTNSFGGSPITLGEFGLSERAREINRLAGEAGARGGGGVYRWAHAVRDRQRGARHQAADAGQCRLRHAGSRTRGTMPRPAGWRRGRYI